MLVTEKVDKERVADTLDAAADYMEEHGWCQGRAMDIEGRVCLIGAIARRTRTRMRMLTPLFYHARDAVEDYLTNDALPDSEKWGAVAVSFNDEPGRTKEDVVTVLRKTAIRVKEKVDG